MKLVENFFVPDQHEADALFIERRRPIPEEEFEGLLTDRIPAQRDWLQHAITAAEASRWMFGVVKERQTQQHQEALEKFEHVAASVSVLINLHGTMRQMEAMTSEEFSACIHAMIEDEQDA